MDPINPHTGLAASLFQDEAKAKKSEKNQGFTKIFGKKQSSDSTQTSSLPELEGSLEEILDGIHSLGESLIQNPSVNNIQNYKRHVKSFMNQVLKSAYGVEEQEGRMRKNFQRPKYTLVKIIDEKMERLAAAILSGQKNQMDILKRLEEIQGLLVDLSL